MSQVLSSGNLQVSHDITYGSVCSGIEAATVAWAPLGWKAAWFAEIEPFPSAVLAHHYPEVPNLGDMTAIARRVLLGDVAAPDVLVGGTPCQAFSVAGMRQSLDDARGNLTLRFMELANAIDFVRRRAGRPPVRIVWENVPGVLSTKDNAFGCFLAGLAGEDVELVPPGKRWSNAGCVYGPARAIAWRTLDAQYFRLAQRRRRVFVVASAGDGFDPSQVLLEWEGVRRDSAPRRTSGQSTASSLAASAGHHGYSSPRGDGSDNLVAGTVTSSAGGADENDAANGRLLAFGGNDTRGPVEVATARNAHGGPHGRLDFESETFIVADTLRGHPRPGSNFLGAIAFDTTQITSGANRSSPKPGDPCHPLAAHAHPPAVAFAATDYREGAFEAIDAAGPLTTSADRTRAAPVAVGFQGVRRLTPVECERLQGFLDGYTDIPYRNGFAADGPRYKALGNSMATHVMAWIGRRLNAHIERIARDQEAA